MCNQLFLGLFLSYTLHEFVIVANPVEIPQPSLAVLPFRFLDNSNLLPNQGLDLNENANLNNNRKKRFLEDLIYLYNFYEDYDEEDEYFFSSEEESSEEEEHDPCLNGPMTSNTAYEDQNIQNGAAPSTEASLQNAPNNNVENNAVDPESVTVQEMISSTTEKHEAPTTTEKLVPTVTEKPVEPAGKIAILQMEADTTSTPFVEALADTTAASNDLEVTTMASANDESI